MENISIDLKNIDLKTVIRRKKHEVKIEDEFKYKDLPSDEVITVFTLHKEYNELNKDEQLQIMIGLLDYVVTELGRINHNGT
jgi:hypothetical protein